MSLCVGISCEKDRNDVVHFCGHGRFELTCEWCMVEKLILRIETLEEILPRYDELHKEWWKRIEELESQVSAINKQKFSEFHHLKPDMEKLQKQIDNWEEEFYFLKDKLRCPDKKPHKCPVCHGEIKILIDPATPMSGIQAMFGKRDENGMYYKDCKACEGKGILWG